MSSSNNASDAVGMKVDLETKALVMVSIYAALKFGKQVAATSGFIMFARVFFLLGHAYLVYIYLVTNFRISKSSSRSTEEKAKAKGGCFAVLRSVLIRAAILGFVHYRTGMLPPMFITVFMGFFSFFENDFYYQIMYSKLPHLFELMYR
jgi:hypothetical protein